MIVWMYRHARGIKATVGSDAASALAAGSTMALVGMAFLAVLREGFDRSSARRLPGRDRHHGRRRPARARRRRRRRWCRSRPGRRRAGRPRSRSPRAGRRGRPSRPAPSSSRSASAEAALALERRLDAARVAAHPDDHVGDRGDRDQADHRLQPLLLLLGQLLRRPRRGRRRRRCRARSRSRRRPTSGASRPASLLDQEGGDDADDQRGLDALSQGDDESRDHG